MKDKKLFWNPFRMISPRLNSEFGGIDELHRAEVSTTRSPEESILIMFGKLIQATKLLRNAFQSESEEKIKECAELIAEVHAQEKFATTGIVGASSAIGHTFFRMVVRFPSRIERIGTMFDTILNTLRIKIKEGIPFSDKAQAELEEMFALMSELLINLRDCLVVNNRILLAHITTRCEKLAQVVEDARFAHWDRLEAGYCSPNASSIFLCILDSVKSINQYVCNMKDSLTEISE